MPALRHSPRRSSRLQNSVGQPNSIAKRSTRKSMATQPAGGQVDPPPQALSDQHRAAPVTTKRGGRGKASRPTQKGPSISWDSDPTRTDKLVAWIVNHAADRHILFHDRSSNNPPPALSPDDRPSGKHKKGVAAAIAEHIFKEDHDYGELYKSDPGKFVSSVINRLST